MNTDTLRFKIGSIDCISINDGYQSVPVEKFFDNVPLETVQRALRARNASADQIELAYGVIYVDTGDHKVLIDTGLGGLDPECGLLRAGLQDEGIQPEEIDTIIITHAHPDHTGGLLDEMGGLAYPNARIYAWQREWDFWLGDQAVEKFGSQDAVDFIRDVRSRVEPILTAVEPGSEVVPGISVLDARGHTPGHLVVLVESGAESLICISDLVFHPLKLEHPDWLPEAIYMIDQQDYVQSKRRVLNLAAEKRALVHAMHFAPFPSLGRVAKVGEAWSWTPI